LRPELAELRKYYDRVLGLSIPLARCFEKPAPPSRALLRWLIENPEQLRWPERRLRERVVYTTDTQRKREALVDGPDFARAEAQAEALAELARLGPEGSQRRWWAFEGHTEVDCWLETDRLLLFVEGKRTEALSSSTHWFPARNQLVRNLEVVGELAAGRVAAVLLVSEEPIVELTPADVAASSPHLADSDRDALLGRYLGQTTWRALCAQLGVDYAALPKTIADVLTPDSDFRGS
jgi:hypothetical protein